MKAREGAAMEADRELLEMAAKAAGMQVLREGIEWPRGNVGWFFCVQHGIPALHDRASAQVWKPLHDDGDALRLAVKMPELSLQWIIAEAWQALEDHLARCAYVRRAIVRAAASRAQVPAHTKGEK
jgi:hypothetical protein